MTDDTPVPPEQVIRLAAEYGMELTAEQAARVDAYCRLLWEWNERLNLTRHLDYQQFVGRDLLDAYQLALLLRRGERVLDVGSGGGVPGILLAILRPDVHLSLSESTAKKARVLEDMVQRLGLDVAVFPQRAEQVVAGQRFDTLVARAVGSVARVLRWFRHHWDHIGRLLLVKGPQWVEERKEARHYGLLRPLELRRLAVYPMPGTDAEVVILGLWRKS